MNIEFAQLHFNFMRSRRRLRVGDVTVVEQSSLKKAIVGSVVGNIMEWYDVGVYGYVAVIIGQQFLPDATPTTQNLFSLGVFATTFFARPLGGVILGQLGDRIGRKEVLAFTLTLMALATFLIGILPAYAALGIAAPILLILLKLLQGFSTGGEYAGATTFITEYAPDKRRGFYASLLDWGSYLGFALGAAFVSILQLTVTEDFMNSWGWRIPFMVALPLGVIALYFRTHIEDTPAFVAQQANQSNDGGDDETQSGAESENEAQTSETKESKLVGNGAGGGRIGDADRMRISDMREAIQATDSGPKGLKDLLKSYWRELLTAFVLVAAANTIAYAVTSYMPTYLSTTLGYDAVHGNLLTLPVLVFLAFLVPVCGWLSDHVGRRKLLFSASIAGVVLAIPAFVLLDHGAVGTTIAGLFLLVIPVALYVGNMASSLPALFPTESRYGGMGVSYNAAVALFGGTAGLIMEALVASTGSILAPAFWIMGTSVAGFIAVTQVKETARRPLPGSMPAVASVEDAQALVRSQENNPDIDVEALFAQAPLEVIAHQPTVEEARAEVAVAKKAEEAAHRELQRARQAVMAARVAASQAAHREANALGNQRKTRKERLLDRAERRAQRSERKAERSERKAEQAERKAERTQQKHHFTGR